VEDPPEYPIPGAIQTPVANVSTAEERSAAFQAAIKAAMRLDPDVIMIGEIRDTPSASLALQAAMTGHQVWTTLHANNSIAIVDRLIDLGVPAEILCDPAIVSGLVSQRLVKTLCPHCKVSLKNAIGSLSIREEYERIAKYIDLESVYIKGEGCDKCSGSGLLGRTVVSEVILPDNKIMEFFACAQQIFCY